jgi:hypothetical protein
METRAEFLARENHWLAAILGASVFQYERVLQHLNEERRAWGWQELYVTADGTFRLVPLGD